MAYAKGKYAKFISDRSGLQFPYTEMVTEWTGAKVHTSVTIFQPSHGYTTSDTVRFRDIGAPLWGASESEIEVSVGFNLSGSTIADDTYTITVTTAPNRTALGGGGMASVGPVTLSA